MVGCWFVEGLVFRSSGATRHACTAVGSRDSLTPMTKGSIRSRQSKHVGSSERYESSPGVDKIVLNGAGGGEGGEGREIVRGADPLPPRRGHCCAAPPLSSSSLSPSSPSAASSRKESEPSSARASCGGPNTRQLADRSKGGGAAAASSSPSFPPPYRAACMRVCVCVFACYTRTSRARRPARRSKINLINQSITSSSPPFRPSIRSTTHPAPFPAVRTPAGCCLHLRHRPPVQKRPPHR